MISDLFIGSSLSEIKWFEKAFDHHNYHNNPPPHLLFLHIKHLKQFIKTKSVFPGVVSKFFFQNVFSSPQSLGYLSGISCY